MEIRVREKCQNCMDGELDNPAWLAWHEREVAELGEPPTEVNSAERQEWFVRWDAWEKENPSPPDTLQCIECDATTWVQKWVTVEEFADKANEILRQIGPRMGGS